MIGNINPGFESLCRVRADLSGMEHALQRVNGADGPYDELRFNIAIQLGAIELSARVEWVENVGNPWLHLHLLGTHTIKLPGHRTIWTCHHFRGAVNPNTWITSLNASHPMGFDMMSLLDDVLYLWYSVKYMFIYSLLVSSTT